LRALAAPHDKSDPHYKVLYTEIMALEKRRYELQIIVKAAQKQHTAHKRALELALRRGAIDKTMDNDIARLKVTKGSERDALINKLTHKFGAEVVSGLLGQNVSVSASVSSTTAPRGRASSTSTPAYTEPDVVSTNKLPSLSDRALASSSNSQGELVVYKPSAESDRAAPFGRKPDGTPYKSNAGRRSK
jgi:hypothetical protein